MRRLTTRRPLADRVRGTTWRVPVPRVSTERGETL